VLTLASENTFPQNAATIALERGRRITLSEAHSLLGHAAITTVKKTAHSYGWIISDLGNGEQEIKCQSCAEAKARQANVPKSIRNPSNIPGERLFMDISSVKKESFGGRAKFWLLVIDEATDCTCSFFITKKNTTQEKINELVGFINGMGDRKVKFIRCDNAGENTKAEEVLTKAGHGIKFEFTAPGTPQHNGKVERKFATLMGRVRAMMNNSGMKEKIREGLWAEIGNTATLIDNGLTTEGNQHINYKTFFGTARTPIHVRIKDGW
jgi:transposase InsO family protein